jgi:hypothetical protein
VIVSRRKRMHEPGYECLEISREMHGFVDELI